MVNHLTHKDAHCLSPAKSFAGSVIITCNYRIMLITYKSTLRLDVKIYNLLVEISILWRLLCGAIDARVTRVLDVGEEDEEE